MIIDRLIQFNQSFVPTESSLIDRTNINDQNQLLCLNPKWTTREKKNYVIESIHGSLDLNAFLWCSDYVVTEWFVYYCRDQCVYCQNVWNNDGKMLKKQLKSIHPEKSGIIYGCMAFILMLIKIYWWLQQRPQFHFNSHVALCMWIRVNVFFDGCLLILLILLFI